MLVEARSSKFKRDVKERRDESGQQRLDFTDQRVEGQRAGTGSRRDLFRPLIGKIESLLA